MKTNISNFNTAVGNWFSSLWNDNLKPAFQGIGESISNFNTAVGNWFGSLWNDRLKPAFQSMGENVSNFNTSVGNWFSNLWTNISNKFTKWEEEKAEEKRQEELNKKSNENKINEISSNVNGLIGDKFEVFYSLKDFLVEFWNAIFESDTSVPEFTVTLPNFCGGGTYNVLDLRFYNQYRNYMIETIFTIAVIIIVVGLLVVVPVFTIQIPTGVATTLIGICKSACYLLPIRLLMPIVIASFSYHTFRFLWSVFLRVKSLLPTGGGGT